MKGSKWFIVFPVLLICISLSDLYLLLFVDEKLFENEQLQQYYGVTSMTSSLLYLILNALIAYIIYVYKEGKALIVIHILYILLILGSINAGPREPIGQLFNFVMQLALDISAVVYATKIKNQKLAFWIKAFVISVLADTLLSMVLPIFLDAKTTGVVNTLIATGVIMVLALFFWNLPSIKLVPDEDDKGPDDLLSRKDLW